MTPPDEPLSTKWRFALVDLAEFTALTESTQSKCLW